jgi:hypothetical protein
MQATSTTGPGYPSAFTASYTSTITYTNEVPGVSNDSCETSLELLATHVLAGPKAMLLGSFRQGMRCPDRQERATR